MDKFSLSFFIRSHIFQRQSFAGDAVIFALSGILQETDGF